MSNRDVTLCRSANRLDSLRRLPLVFALALAACSEQPMRPRDGLAMPGTQAAAVASSGLVRANGEVHVVLELIDTPLAALSGRNATRGRSALSRPQQQDYLRLCEDHQNAVSAQIQSFGGRELARVNKALVALAVAIDPSKIKAIAALPNVRRVLPVIDYELDDSETVAHIGAAAVQAEGFDGRDVRIAVLDTGIDYTHAFLGGPGTADAYTTAYGTSTSDPRNTLPNEFFPNERIAGGYDFVGEAWPNGALAPDPNPIDCGPAAIPPPCAGGHGSHVADIIGGNYGNDHRGVAPRASIYAVKACSSVSTSCSGIALLQAIDFALDPDGHGDVANPVDIIHMSLGSSYGQADNSLSVASVNAARMGVIVVASAGNSGDRPYIVGSPSSAPEVISVAQTTVPSDKLYLIRADQAPPIGSLYQTWSATPVFTSGPLVYDQTNMGTRIGCSDDTGTNPYAPGSHAGEILLMDRGLCAVSFKVSNAAVAGAIAAIVANNVAQPPGELPPSFSFGGGTPSIPGYTVTLADGNTLKATAGNATIDPDDAASLVNHMVSTSSRGPSFTYNAIKPDIGAPGASVSAIAGSGFGEDAFGGTSGAAPMVTGSVALMLQRYPERPPFEIKSALMNTAETEVFLNLVALPGVLAPITRIGGGEVRVDKAFHSTTAAWDADDLTGSLSFGYHALTAAASFRKTVAVRNYSDTPRTYSVTASFRSENEAKLGAVSLDVPASITVPAHRRRSFDVNLRVDPSRLRPWTLNGGSRGGDGYRLQEFQREGPFEFDGYIHISDEADDVHVAWQILPHKAAAVTPDRTDVVLEGGTATDTLSNEQGATDGRVDVFSLLAGTEERGPIYPFIILRSVGVRQAGDNIQFAFNTFGERSHPNYPASFQVFIQGRGGGDDFLVFNRENGSFGTTGQNVVAVTNLTTMVQRIVFFADADLDSANAILTVPLNAVNLTPDTQFNFSARAVDNLYTGEISHAITGLTYTPAVPRYQGSGIPPTGVPAGGSSTLTIDAVPGGETASPSQVGLLLMYRDAVPGREADPITVTP